MCYRVEKTDKTLTSVEKETLTLSSLEIITDALLEIMEVKYYDIFEFS